MRAGEAVARVRGSETLIVQEVKKHGKDKKIEKKNDAFQIFEQTLQFLSLFGLLIGAHSNYEWKDNSRFKFTYALVVAAWTQFVYTQSLHVYNHDNIRTLEVFALYGIGISVI